MTGRYLLRIGDRVHGPIAIDELRAWDAAGRIPDHAEIAEESEGIFYRRESMQYLFEAAPTPRAAPPAMPGGAGPTASGRGASAGVPAARASAAPAQRASAGGQRQAAAAAWSRPSAPAASDGGGVWDDLDRVVASRAHASTAMMAGFLSGLALVALVVAAVSKPWVGVTLDTGTGADVRRVTIEVNTMEIRTLIVPGGSRPTGSSLEYLDGVAGVEARMRQDPELYAPIAPGHVLQSRMLLMAGLGLLGLSGLAGIIGGLVGRNGQRIPGGTGPLALIGGLLSAICVGSLALLGIVHGVGGVPGASKTFGPALWIALVGTVLVLVAGVMLFRAAAIISKTQRGRRQAKRRPGA